MSLNKKQGKNYIYMNFRIRIMGIHIHKTLFYEAITTDLASAVATMVIMCFEIFE